MSEAEEISTCELSAMDDEISSHIRRPLAINGKYCCRLWPNRLAITKPMAVNHTPVLSTIHKGPSIVRT